MYAVNAFCGLAWACDKHALLGVKLQQIVQPTVQLYDMCTSVSTLSHKQTMHVTQKRSVESSYSH